MATGFDDLVERLLYDVALSGSRGIGAEELTRAIRAFYELHKQNVQAAPENDEDLLFSDAPSTGPNVVDDDLVDTVWDWLSRHPDVVIRAVNDAKLHNNQAATSQQTAPQPSTLARPSTPAQTSTSAQLTAFAQPTTPSNPTASAQSSTSRRHADQRIFTGEDRVWQVIAGHGVDHSRIPPRQFDCLSVIAAHGADGILQPDVTRLTGQDKRSVPKRTDKLAEHGYIVKTTVLSKGAKTTLLKLRKFADDTSLSQHARAYPESRKPAEENLAYYDVWFDGTVNLLKSNANIVAYQDIRIGLGIHKKKWETKAFARCIRRLVAAGCLRKLKARIEGDSGDPSAGSWVRCLQLQREPTESDRWKFRSKAQFDPSQAEKAARVMLNDRVAKEDVGSEVESDDEAEDNIQDAQRIPPQWTPDLPYTNFVFNIIDNAGPDGISSMDLNARAMGPLWRRPLDEVMLRLTDTWQTSQPPHLRHLSIVRDTATQGKLAHFQYRSLANFEKAVQAGQTMWEAVIGNTKAKGKGKKAALANSPPDLDQWGFPKLDSRLFAGKDGTASLLECGEQARKDVKLALEKERGSLGFVPVSVDAGGQNKPRRGRKRKFMETPVSAPAPLPLPTPTSVSPVSVLAPTPVTESMTEVLHNAGASTARKRSAKAARQDSTGPSKKSRRFSQAPSNATELEHDAETSQSRLEEDEVETQLVRGTKPGVYINPPNSLDSRFEDRKIGGRRPKAVVAVFRSDRLRDLGWFAANGGGRAPTSTNRHDSAGDEGHPEAEEEERRPRKRRKRNAEGVLVDTIPPNPYVTHTVTPSNDVSAPESPAALQITPTPKKRRGRPPKIRPSEREDSGFSMFKTMLPPATPSDPPAVVGTLLSTSPPQAGEVARFDDALPDPALTALEAAGMIQKKRGRRRKDTLPERDDADSSMLAATSPLLAPSGSSISENTGLPPPGIRSEIPVETPLSVDKAPSTPALPMVSDSSFVNATPLPKKKRGRPSKADIAERERLQKEQEDRAAVVDVESTSGIDLQPPGETPSLVVRFAVPRTVALPAPEGQTVQSTSGQGPTARPSRIVRLPLPSTPSLKDAVSLPTTNEPVLVVPQQTASSAPTQENIRSRNTPATQHLRIIRPYYQRDGIVAAEVPNLGEVGALQLPHFESTDSRRRVRDVLKEGDGSATNRADEQARPTRTFAPPIDRHGELPDPDQLGDWLDPDLAVVYEPVLPSSDAFDANDNIPGIADALRHLPDLLPAEVHDDFNYKEKVLQKAGTSRQGGIVDLHRTDIVLRTVEKAGGVFPGDNEMWYPFWTAWYKMKGQMPDRHTVDNVALRLVKQQKLKRVCFRFRDEKDRVQKRHIIMEPHIEPASSQVRKVQKAMIQAWPHRYLPKEVDIYPPLRKRAQKHTVEGGVVKPDLPGKKDVPWRPFPSRDPNADPEWDEFPFARDITVRRTADAIALADAEAQAKGYADAKKHREATLAMYSKGHQQVRLRSALQKAGPEFASEHNDMLDDSDDEDIDPDAPVSEQQAALQSDFQVERYRHEPTAVPDKFSGVWPRKLGAMPAPPKRRLATFRTPFPGAGGWPSKSGGRALGRSTFARQPTTKFWGNSNSPLLMRPGQEFYAVSGTFGTTGVTHSTDRGTEPGSGFSKRSVSAASSAALQYQTVPTDLYDVLTRATMLGHHPANQSEFLRSQFLQELQQVRAWEVDLVSNERQMASPAGVNFINHGLNRPHVVSKEVTRDESIAFVDGGLRQLEAEKEKRLQLGPKKRRRKSTLTKYATPTLLSPFSPQGLNTGVASSGALYPGPELPNQLLLPFTRRSEGSPASLIPNSASQTPSRLPHTSTFAIASPASAAPLLLNGRKMSGYQGPNGVEISKITGKPKRPYTFRSKKPSEQPDRVIVGKAGELLYSKIYVDQHSDEKFVHRSRGRYAKVPANDGDATGAENEVQTPQSGGFAESEGGLRPGTNNAEMNKTTQTKQKKRREELKDPAGLAIAVALSRALCSGIKEKQVVNWDIVAHALSFEYEHDFLKQRWNYQLHSEYGKPYAENIQQQLYEPFLVAYEDGRLPGVDFENPQNTDWPLLLRWAKDEISRNQGPAPVLVEDLPESREVLQKGFNIESQSQHPASEDCETSNFDQNLIVGKSWARAVAMTSQENFDEQKAAQKMGILDSKMLERIVEELLLTNTLRQAKPGRQYPGRNYRISDDVLFQFKRWPADKEETQFLADVANTRTKLIHFLADVANTRTKLIQHFEQHDQYELDAEASEAHMLVLTNMVAQGYLSMTTVLPGESRELRALEQDMRHKIQSAFRFPIFYKKTAAFTAEHGLQGDVSIPRCPAALPGEPDSRIPFWIDIHRNLLEDEWSMVLRSVLHLLVFKPGSTAKAIEAAHNSKLWAWEIELVLEWMEKVGIAERLGAGHVENGVWKGGWRASEHWYCAFLPRAAGPLTAGSCFKHGVAL